MQSGPGHVSERRVHSTRLHLRRREGLLGRERRVQMRWVDRASDVPLGLGPKIVTSPSFFSFAAQVRRRRVNPTSSSARTAAVHSSCGAATETTTARTTPTRPTAVSFPSVSVVRFLSFSPPGVERGHWFWNFTIWFFSYLDEKIFAALMSIKFRTYCQETDCQEGNSFQGPKK